MVKTWRWAFVLMGIGAATAVGCDSEEETGTSAGTESGTATGGGTVSGTQSGTASGTSTGTGGGTGGGTTTGADPCDPSSTLSDEDRFRASCSLMVEHQDWGQCSGDPTEQDALNLCATDPICDSCDYLWWPGATYGNYAICLAETALLRCCLLEQPSPFTCDMDDITVFQDASAVTACASEYSAFETCMMP